MQVRATKTGYGGNPVGLRQAGDEFEVPEGTKGSWFKPVSEAGPRKEVKPVTDEPQTLSEYAKNANKTVPAVAQQSAPKADANDLV